MKTCIVFAFLASLLMSCAPAIMPAATQTSIPPTATYTPTAEMTPISDVPTPLPTQPTIPILTPDSVQVENWKEYQTELAKSIVPQEPAEWALCEWEILGSSDQKLYVWAVCNEVSVPALIYLGADGNVKNVEVPGVSSDWGSDIRRMFPQYVQEKFNYYQFGRVKEMLAHLKWRQTHPDEPPLNVLSTTPTITPTP
jgi:hypothetical protein